MPLFSNASYVNVLQDIRMFWSQVIQISPYRHNRSHWVCCDRLWHAPTVMCDNASFGCDNRYYLWLLTLLYKNSLKVQTKLTFYFLVPSRPRLLHGWCCSPDSGNLAPLYTLDSGPCRSEGIFQPVSNWLRWLTPRCPWITFFHYQLTPFVVLALSETAPSYLIQWALA